MTAALKATMEGDVLVLRVEGLGAPAQAAPVDDLVELPGPYQAKAIARLRKSGELPARKIGQIWYARRSDLLRLVAGPRAVTDGTPDTPRPARAPGRRRAATSDAR